MTASVSIALENDQQIVTMCQGDLIAKINADEGANVFVLKNEKDKLDILLQADDPDNRILDFPLFGMPILLPPSRIAGGKFSFDGKDYNLPIFDILDLPNNIHGFLFFEKWKIDNVNVCEEKCSVMMRYESSESSFFYEYFPHKFVVEMDCILTEKGLEKIIRVINNDTKAMPFGLGWHTFFNVPFCTDGSADACFLKVTVGDEWIFGDHYIPTGEKRGLTEELKNLTDEGLSLDNRALLNDFTSKPIELDGKSFNGAIITDKSNGRKLYYEVGEEYGHWTVWNANGNDGFICPEPQTIVTDAFNLVNRGNPDTGFIKLEPGETFRTFEKVYWD
jgi:aldose 1-epimerase